MTTGSSNAGGAHAPDFHPRPVVTRNARHVTRNGLLQ